MPVIQVLDRRVSELIAAGEVVERPGSVLKELLENAIDAGASAVTAELMSGGLSYLRVTDNGCGIAAEDVETAFLRHATSKIKSASDLDAIGTLGFRGEALAAVAAVSRVSILTRARGEQSGTAFSIEGGAPGELTPAGCPEGTTLIVRDLFFNTPARMKFMKKDSAEGAFASGVAQQLALSHPEISFKLIRDGRVLFHTPGDGQILSCCYGALGRETALGLLPARGSDETMTLEGLVSRPACCRGTRGEQFFFVNGRFIRSRHMAAALEEAYKNRKMTGRFPVCVLRLTLPPGMVDVNVHPAKTEVKFSNDRAVFGLVYHTVCAALDAESGAPAAPQSAAPSPRTGAAAPRADFFQTMTAETFRASARAEETPRPQARQRDAVWVRSELEPGGMLRDAAALFSRAGAEPGAAEETAAGTSAGARPGEGPGAKPETAAGAKAAPETGGSVSAAAPAPAPQTAAPAPEDAAPEAEGGPWRVAGEVLKTYIIVEQGTRVLFIDKHAAHERMHFDRLCAEGHAPMSQGLLSPLVFTPGGESGDALREHLPLLARLGFEAEDFGGGSLIVRRIPGDMDREQAQPALEELGEILAGGGRVDPARALDRLLRVVACKAAIKAGRQSDPAELEAVAAAVMEGRVKYCPHGRPVAFELTRAAIERRFGR